MKLFVQLRYSLLFFLMQEISKLVSWPVSSTTQVVLHPICYIRQKNLSK